MIIQLLKSGKNKTKICIIKVLFLKVVPYITLHNKNEVNVLDISVTKRKVRIIEI